MNCIFCKIIDEKIPSYKIYEDEHVLAFLDISPIQDGHALLIPKEHYVTLLDMPDELLAHFNKVSKKIYKSIMENIKCDGITIIQNNGSCQDVKHYHVHFVPRFNEDKAVKYAQFGNKDILKDIQETIKEV